MIMFENFFIRSAIRKVVIMTYIISYDTRYNKLVWNPGANYL